MKEFEKYKYKACQTCTVDSCISMCNGCIEIQQRRIGWRAALEFVMRRGMHHYGNDFLFMDLCKDIREELEK